MCREEKKMWQTPKATYSYCRNSVLLILGIVVVVVMTRTIYNEQMTFLVTFLYTHLCHASGEKRPLIEQSVGWAVDCFPWLVFWLP